MRWIFIGPKGLRAGWRFLLFAVLSMLFSNLLLLGLRSGLGYKGHAGLDPRDFLLGDGLSLIAAVAAAALLSRLDRRPLADSGLPLRAPAATRWIEGFVWAALAVLVLVMPIAALHGMTFHGLALRGEGLLSAAGLWLATMVVLGLYEEFVFRGYPLVALSEGLGFWPAAVALALVFAGVHYFLKPMENGLDALNVGLIGLFFAYSFMRTGTLWFAAGFHTAYDFLALSVLAAPNTANNGQPVPGHLLNVTYTGPDWLTGGVRGIEASVFMLPVLLALFALGAWRWRSSAAKAAVFPARARMVEVA